MVVELESVMVVRMKSVVVVNLVMVVHDVVLTVNSVSVVAVKLRILLIWSIWRELVQMTKLRTPYQLR